MGRRLATIAKEINEVTPYTATIQRGYSSTDRPKPKGCRYKTHVGKGRWGNQLIVRDETGRVVLDHNAAETYRCNEEVEEWLRDVKLAMRNHPKVRVMCPHCNVKLVQKWTQRPPFADCPKCHSTFLAKAA
jgi:hypothetical protein